MKLTYKAFVEMGPNGSVINLIEVVLEPTDSSDMRNDAVLVRLLPGQRVVTRERRQGEELRRLWGFFRWAQFGHVVRHPDERRSGAGRRWRRYSGIRKLPLTQWHVEVGDASSPHRFTCSKLDGLIAERDWQHGVDFSLNICDWMGRCDWSWTLGTSYDPKWRPNLVTNWINYLPNLGQGIICLYVWYFMGVKRTGKLIASSNCVLIIWWWWWWGAVTCQHGYQSTNPAVQISFPPLLLYFCHVVWLSSRSHKVSKVGELGEAYWNNLVE